MTEENDRMEQVSRKDMASDVVPDASESNWPEAPPETTSVAPANKESIVASYLKKAGKAMAVFAVIGCCFLMFAAWLLISTINQITQALSK